MKYNLEYTINLNNFVFTELIRVIIIPHYNFAPDTASQQLQTTSTVQILNDCYQRFIGSKFILQSMIVTNSAFDIHILARKWNLNFQLQIIKQS